MAREGPRVGRLARWFDDRLRASHFARTALNKVFPGVAVPLMTADRWFIVDPDLRGIQIREDGVPRFQRLGRVCSRPLEGWP